MSFVLLGPSDHKSMHVLVTQAIPCIIVDEFHARELASALNAAMAMHKNNAQERSNAGRPFQYKMKLKMDPPKYVS